MSATTSNPKQTVARCKAGGSNCAMIDALYTDTESVDGLHGYPDRPKTEIGTNSDLDTARRCSRGT